MAVITDPRIEQAKQLIQQKKRDAARELLVSYLKTSPNDTAALYLYAFVARNPEEAKRVLRKVLEINPMNYQARAALNKIENRSVEQQPVAPPPPTRPEWKSPISPPAISRAWTLYAGGAVALLMILAALGMMIANAANEEATAEDSASESVEEIALVMTEEIQPTVDLSTPTITFTPFPEDEVAVLVATWTPRPSATLAPTRTLAPTLTPFPTRTLVPTFTPTQPQVEAVTISLESASRLYTEYTELAAQAAWSEDAGQLQGITDALTAMISSLEISDYDEAPADVMGFFEGFLTLLRQERAFVETRVSQVTLQAQAKTLSDGTEKQNVESELVTVEADVETLAKTRLRQQETVDLLFWDIISSATATATFREQVESLKTPSATPVVLPTSEPIEEQGE